MARARGGKKQSKRARSLAAKKGWCTRRRKERERKQKPRPTSVTYLLSIDYPKKNKKGKVTGRLLADIVVSGPPGMEPSELAEKIREELPKKYKYLGGFVEGSFADISILEEPFRGKAKVRNYTKR